MLDICKALKPINGKKILPWNIRCTLEGVLAKNLHEVPPEFTACDLFLLAVKAGYVKEIEYKKGNYCIKIDIPGCKKKY